MNKKPEDLQVMASPGRPRVVVPSEYQQIRTRQRMAAGHGVRLCLAGSEIHVSVGAELPLVLRDVNRLLAEVTRQDQEIGTLERVIDGARERLAIAAGLHQPDTYDPSLGHCLGDVEQQLAELRERRAERERHKARLENRLGLSGKTLSELLDEVDRRLAQPQARRKR